MFLYREDGVEHGDDAAFHVARATPKYEVVFASRLELLRGLRWNHIVMAVEIKRSLPAPKGRQQTGMFLVGLLAGFWRLESLAIEMQLARARFEQIRASPIICSRRILCRNSNKLGEKRGHFFLAPVQPGNNRIGS